MKLFVRISLMTAVLIFGALSVYACSCADPSVREKFRWADVVFVGELVEKADAEQNSSELVHSTRFKVEKSWKGVAARELKILFGFDMPGMCGDLPLNIGERYLIYAYRRKEGLITQVDCGPNRIAENVPDEINKLNGFWFRMFARLYPYPKF
jgi:hypothetical protein